MHRNQKMLDKQLREELKKKPPVQVLEYSEHVQLIDQQFKSVHVYAERGNLI